MEETQEDLTSKAFIKNLLQDNQIRPIKRLGQNFLISRTVLHKIIQVADIQKSDVILEIGAGIGTLTKELARKAKHIVAIEKDKRMITVLKETLKNFSNVKIIQADILKLENGSIVKLLNCSNYKVVANLPYYITSPIIKKFLESENPPSQMVLMIQKEVAQRIIAKPPRMNLLAVSVQFYSKPKIISYVSKKCFWPEPKVDSAILQIAPLINADKRLINADLFFKIAKAGFSHPRKQLINNLSKKLELEKEKVKDWLFENNIEPSQRAQTLSLKDWTNLAKTFKNIIIK